MFAFIRKTSISFLLLAGASLSTHAKEISFNRDIRPILSENCYYCHGADEADLAADLRLDRRERAVEAGAIIPHNAAESPIIQRIYTEDPDDIMPPPETHKTLSAEEKDLLTRWINEGAVYEKHWSFTEVKSFPEETIDSLVVKGLTPLGLSLSPPAEKETLLRRVSLDITGLPPTLKEREAFLQDSSEGAYEKLVERLLDSPHYGERMAVEWLDAVRYADTVGYHGDPSRDATPFRDYVIASFNENKSFKDFTIEQIAGDLLPDATLMQKVASSYNRLNQMSQEGGIQNEEYVKKYQAERVRTTSTAWLGLTVACAECHDHKFDPITAKDFYSMAAFFADIYEAGAWTGVGKFNGEKKEIEQLFPDAKNDQMWFGHELSVPNDTFRDPYEVAEKKAAALREELAQGTPDTKADLARWLEYVKRHNKTAQAEMVLTFDPDKKDPQKPSTEITLEHPLPVEILSNFRVSNINATLAGVGQNSFKALFTKSDGTPYNATVYWGLQYGPHLKDTHYTKRLGDVTQTAVNRVIQIPLSYFKPPAGSKLVSLVVVAPNVGRMTLSTFMKELEDRPLTPAELAEISAYDGTLPLSEGLEKAFYTAHAPSNVEKRWRLRQLTEKRTGMRTVPYTISSPSPREVKILPRGSWQDTSGEVVLPASLHFLPNPISSTPEKRLTRLDLAQWIVDEQNPLTARNYVNRLWQLFFGRALSSAAEDLGLQGYYPEYPELLDHLASEFMRSGWDVKHLVKMIITSEVYQQESLLSAEMKERDPYNKLLARQSARRLPAEFIRDNALATSGLLEKELYGASVKPYQPEGYYGQLNYPVRRYISHEDERQYRRGVYVHWQRTFLHPMLVNFDAPARDECYVSRPEANTPLQALNLLNDPSFVEAAKALAVRVLLEEGADPVKEAFNHVLLRDPEEREKQVLNTVFQDSLTLYTASPEKAEALLSVGLKDVPSSLSKPKLAALMQACRALYNLHESITRY